MTPAQQAKEYAAANGFTIRQNGRRYDVDYGLAHVANVGGYPAALNAMRTYEPPEMQDARIATTFNANIPDECAASGASCHYAANGRRGELQCKYCGKPDERAAHCDVVSADGAMGVFAETVIHGRGETPTLLHVDDWPTKTPEQISADIIDGVKRLQDASADIVAMQTGTGKTLDDLGQKYQTPKRKPGQTDAAYRNVLMYGDERGMKYVDFDPSFDSFDAAAQARIHHAAKRIAKQRRRAAHRPPGGPWHVIFDGRTVMKYGYPTRAEAVGVVRWGFNHSDPKIRNNWRTASLAVEYRPS